MSFDCNELVSDELGSAPELEIVAHCWQYSRLAVYQMSSLVLNPIGIPVRYTLYYSEEDQLTSALRNCFIFKKVPNLTWCFRSLEQSHLFRRAIGRNHAAKNTKAAWVWFSDVDQVFGPNCLDLLWASLEQTKADLCFPAKAFKCSHEKGDQLIEAASDGPRLRTITPPDFGVHKYPRAIGGVQIVRGNFCREHGYLGHSPYYQRPVKDKWRRTFEDAVFRKFVSKQGSIQRLPGIPMYRIGHSQRGRDTKGLVL